MRITRNALIKAIITVGMIVFFLLRSRSAGYFAFGVIETLIVLALTGLCVRKHPVIAWIVNGILTLLLLAQYATLYFGNSFVSPIMLSNLRSVRSLSGQAVQIIAAVIAVAAVSVLPVRSRHGFTLKKPLAVLVSIVLIAAEAAGMLLFSPGCSPLYALAETSAIMIHSASLTRDDVNRTEEQIAAELEKFHRDGVEDHVAKPLTISEKPNIVLIFTEGLSQSIIDDPRSLMPNLQAFAQESLSFVNYYNHTAATYRGLIGQLYSGHQFRNNDTNQLVSLQGILSDRGYRTVFLNAEPKNKDFTEYLASFGFDELVSTGKNYRTSDKKMYSTLFDQLHASADDGQPLFVSLYTYGTHVSFDSPDETYGDGANAELNKFYNLDVQFGKFLKKFLNDPVSDNTILIFTTDHATYADAAYQESFGDIHPRTLLFCDPIPLMIWYKGVEPMQLDASGRNSLDLAPTVLDFLDISAPNFFLGNTLFAPAPAADSLEYYHVIYPDGTISKTMNGVEVVRPPETERTQVMNTLRSYFLGTKPSEHPID